jgi:hypothetical protein
MTTEETTPTLPPVKIAFIIDGVVTDVLHTDDRLGAIFLSEPKIVDVTEYLKNNPSVNLVKAAYDGNEFFPVALPTIPNA